MAARIGPQWPVERFIGRKTRHFATIDIYCLAFIRPGIHILFVAGENDRPAKESTMTTTDDRAVVRKRGAWTKGNPYERKDGTSTRGTTVYLPVELAERLRRYAFERDVKQNALMVEAIAAFLDTKGA